jgi:flavin reductase (DIM6/NTAB) family NADH-FMN oxidoreductase RutF
MKIQDGASGALSSRELRDALGLFATGVAVVTATADGGERIGATISSFNAVSLEPPLVLFSMARGAKAFAAWRSVPAFAVNVLSQDQSATSTRFARSLGDKWDGVDCVEGSTRAPLLSDSLVAFECVRHADHDGGDHLIIVGRVVAVRICPRAPALPLVFFASSYRRLAGESATPAPVDVSRVFYGW